MAKLGIALLIFFTAANNPWKLNASFCLGKKEEIQNPKSGLEWAYAGAFECMKAEDAWNPYSKYEHFKKGCSFIDKGVSLDSNNVHVRLVRFVIQDQSPEFLGYHSEIEEDEAFLRSNLEAWLKEAPEENQELVIKMLKSTRYYEE